MSKSQRVLRSQPLCEVCRNPSKEAAHLVSRMELRRARSRGIRTWEVRSSDENFAALCKLCHDALDCKLGITDWYVKKYAPSKAYGVLLAHFDRHLYGFQRLLHRRNLMLIRLVG